MNINLSELKQLIRLPSLKGFLVKEILMLLVGIGISWWLFSVPYVMYGLVSMILPSAYAIVILVKINKEAEGLLPTVGCGLLICLALYIVYFGQNYLLRHPGEMPITIFLCFMGLLGTAMAFIVLLSGFIEEIDRFLVQVKNKTWRKK